MLHEQAMEVAPADPYPAGEDIDGSVVQDAFLDEP